MEETIVIIYLLKGHGPYSTYVCYVIPFSSDADGDTRKNTA